MAAKILNSIGSVGVGLAVTGGIINSALFNGNHIIKVEFFTLYHFIGIILSFVNNAIKFYYKAS